jgi:hypothetical protein
MPTAENPHSGQGPVLLDIGDDIGAVVVSMPASTEGLEVGIRPAGATADPASDRGHHHPHVAVVARPTGAGLSYALVYPAVREGEHELFPLPDGPIVLTVAVAGGTVTRATWPDDQP